MERWYALYTKPYREQQVSSFLESRGYETYLPTIRVRKNGQEKTVPFFSCYLFVRVDPSDGFSSVRWTPGLRRIVSFGDQPAVVDERAIPLIKQRLADVQESGWTEYPFKPGDRVLVTSGLFKDFEAVFKRGLSSGQRARILVGFLGRWTPCQVDIDCLKQAG